MYLGADSWSVKWLICLTLRVKCVCVNTCQNVTYFSIRFGLLTNDNFKMFLILAKLFSILFVR